MGVSQIPSVVPMMMSELGSTMTFGERFTNTLLSILDELMVMYHTHVTDYWIQVIVEVEISLCVDKECI